MAIILGTPVVGTSATTSFTNGATSSILVVGLAAQFNSGLGEDTTVTYDSVPMTQGTHKFVDGSGSLFLYYMNSPTTGAHNVVVTPVSSTLFDIRIFIVEVSNTITSQPGATASGSIPNGSPTSTSLACSGTNGVVFDMRFASPDSPLTVGAGQTELFQSIDMGFGINLNYFASYKAYTSGTVTMSWTADTPSSWHTVMEVKGITPVTLTLAATYASYAISAFDTLLKTYVVTNASKPTSSMTNSAKPTSSLVNASKPSSSMTNASKPNP